MAAPIVVSSGTFTREESHKMLSSEFRGHFGRIPSSVVASVAIRVTEGGDHHLAKAAMQALARRYSTMQAGCAGWRSQASKGANSPAGAGEIRSAEGRRYRTVVYDFAELRGACSCADFQRSSIGVCKHLFWRFQEGFDKKGRPNAATAALPELDWNPVRPLTGRGDWLEGVTWRGAALPPALRTIFSGRTPKPVPDDLHTRLRVLEAMQDLPRSTGPALAALIAEEHASLVARRDGAITGKELDRALAGLQRPLFPYQREGVAKFLSRGRLLLADDMGLGKTAQAIASCHALMRSGRVERGLVVVPASLKAQWLREWQLFTETPAAIVEGPPAERARRYRATKRGFLIVNYEQVVKDLVLLRRWAPGVVVLDEAQKIKNWASKTAASVKQLDPHWRLVLTGTPLENRLDELASLMDWVDDRALQPKWRLSEWHAVRSDGDRDVVGARHLDTLRARLAGSTLRRVRKEVLAQLPSRTDTRVPVELTAEQAAAHADFDPPIAQLMARAQSRPLTQPEFLRLMSLMTQQRVICNGLAQRDFEDIWPDLEARRRPTEQRLRGLFAPKLQELRTLVDELVLTQGLKIVVFSQWKRMLHLARWAVSDLLVGAGLEAVAFTGDESLQRRNRNVAQFHDDPRTRLFFATDAGGVGLNLQRAASVVIHLDLPWNPAVLEQRNGRVYRLGQKEPVQVFSLVSTTGIEARIAGIIGDKKALFDGLFDGTTDAVAFERGGSFLSTLHQLVAPEIPTEAVGEAPAEAATDIDVSELDAPAPADPAPSDVVPTPTPMPATGLLPGLSVTRGADGRIVLEAAPEQAALIASLLEGMAALVRQAAAAPPTNP